jgi:hypothetical protein
MGKEKKGSTCFGLATEHTYMHTPFKGGKEGVINVADLFTG